MFTGTRAEYGLLYWLMKDIQASDLLELQILVTAAHLSPEFDLTYKTIESDGFNVTEKIETLLSSDTTVGVVKSMGLAAIGYADALQRMDPDVIVILGDRYEALVVAQAALIMQIPILHIHGGEVTEGAYDDAIRHSISKMSLTHCVTTSEHRNRVIQLGEHPDRVFNVGAIGLDHLRRTSLLTLSELSESLSFDLASPFFVITYHPETLSQGSSEKSFQNLLSALNHFAKFNLIITYPNADDGGRSLIKMLHVFADGQPERVKVVPSLGQQRYLSAIKYASVVIGNSSSGIIEVPSCHTPTVNIGDRQKGRTCAKSVIHCGTSERDITSAIEKALTFADSSEVYENPYGEGRASEQIIHQLETMDLLQRKTFYDLPVGE